MEYLMIPIASAGVITDAKPVTAVLANILIFLLSVVGVVGIIAVVLSGVYYLTANGDEGRARQAKRIMTAAVIGLVVVLGALVVVNQMIGFFS